MSIYYSDESVTLYHGDCREVLASLNGTFDAAVTDPPYGVGLEYSDHFTDTPDYVDQLVSEVLPTLRDRCRIVAVTPGTVNIWRYPPTPSILCWVQTNNVSRASNPLVRLSAMRRAWQPVLVYGDRYAILRSDLYAGVTVSDRSVNHPCPKPREFARWLVGRITNEGETLIDPFAGSGVFLRAAVDMGRRAVGIEIEERHCEEIAKRLAQGVLDFGSAS